VSPDYTPENDIQFHPDQEGGMKLSGLDPRRDGVVREIQGNGAVRQRLMDMGFLPKTPVRMERVAPTGEPVWVRICGGQVALRRSEADAVVLDDLSGDQEAGR
jgi:Fe2+ transport system protein FeoA